MIEWAATTGKPVLMQETGVSNTEVTDADMSRILSVTLASSWAEGAAGYFWWCSHDNSPTYRIPEDLVWKEPSLLKDLKTGEMMGLLTNDNREKPVGRRFRELGGLLETLGVGWAPKNPVVYVLEPESDDFWGTMIDLVQPFVLAKQTHAKVRFLRQRAEVPADAAAVIVPGFALSPEAKRPLDAWLRAGGRLFQSDANDFSPDITVKPGEHLDPAPLVWATGRLGSFASEQYVRLPPTAIRDVTVNDEVEVLARYLTVHEHPRVWDFGKPLFCRTAVGRGTYYYLGAALEKAYVTAWSPWEATDGHAFYAALVPPGRSRSTTRSSSWPTSRADPRSSSSSSTTRASSRTCSCRAPRDVRSGDRGPAAPARRRRDAPADGPGGGRLLPFAGGSSGRGIAAIG